VRDLKVYVLEVVNPGAANNNGFSGHQLWICIVPHPPRGLEFPRRWGVLGSLERGMELSIIKQGSAEAGE
jgi:hypothetical protein